MIDTDVHHEVPSQDAVFPYLASGWQEYVTLPEPQYRISFEPPIPHVNPHGFDREDAIPLEGGPPGSSYELLKDQLLDEFDIDYAVLTFGTGLYNSGISNPYFAAEVARAFNDHMVDEWLARDERLRGSILVASAIPELAAREIERLKDHPQIVQGLMAVNGIGHPFGHPLFDPIQQALAEADLPLAIHAFGESAGSGGVSGTLAAGKTSFYAEYHSGGASQGVMTHLMSFMMHGVFERYPNLRLVLLEGGLWWVPGFLRRLDTNYKGLRREVPWCKRLPSDYFRERVKMSTQPMDVDSANDPLWDLYQQLDLGGTLMFASDYPHWDGDDAPRVRQIFPKDWRPSIFDGNARELYRFPAPPPKIEASMAAGEAESRVD